MSTPVDTQVSNHYAKPTPETGGAFRLVVHQTVIIIGSELLGYEQVTIIETGRIVSILPRNLHDRR